MIDKFTVSAFGVGVIALVYWFFFGGKKSSEMPVEASGSIEVKVSGGYSPSTIKLKKGTSTKIIFKRTDPNSCLEEVIIPDFKIKKYLPLNEKITVTVNPQKSGKFDFHCGMNMFFGKIIVE